MMELMESQNGNHVLQKTLETAKNAKVFDPLVTALKGHVCRMSLNMYGSRIVQRMLQFCEPDQAALLLDEINEY